MTILSGPLLVPVAIIAGVLVVATLAWALLAKLKPASDFRELGLRIKSWWVMASVVLGAVLFVPFVVKVVVGSPVSLLPDVREATARLEDAVRSLAPDAS